MEKEEISAMDLFHEIKRDSTTPKKFVKACYKVLGRGGYTAAQVPQDKRQEIIDIMRGRKK